MTDIPSTFYLTIQQVEQTCLFTLTWGDGQRLTRRIQRSPTLHHAWHHWHQTYLQFYRQRNFTCIDPSPPNGDIRSKVVCSGSAIVPLPDWHSKLVDAEAKLLSEFHRWLQNGALFDLYAQLTDASQKLEQAQTTASSSSLPQWLDLLITCTTTELSTELSRLPWEAWELGIGSLAGGRIRIARSPANIQAPSQKAVSPKRRRPRILAILGDDTNLNFESDRKAVTTLSRLAEIEFIGWQQGKDIDALKLDIQQAIAHPQGWDILFFAGHSNETALTGGELGIAPNSTIQISEIAPQLAIAQQRGLQFALFNSCCGMDIAESLINLGLSQVAIMREPIHNRVAQEFVVTFLQALATYKDVHECLIRAAQFLQTNRNLTFPSAHLVPSLFRHPSSSLFRITPSHWGTFLRQLLPTRLDAIALTTLVLLSVLPAVQAGLLAERLRIQAIYRDMTGQLPVERSPVAFVQIDQSSVRHPPIPLESINPMDRRYLALLVDQLAELDASIIGMDYWLDRSIPTQDPAMKTAVQSAIETNGTWFVFSSVRRQEGEIGVHPETGIAKPEWSLEGYTNNPPGHVRLLPTEERCEDSCPFIYLLAAIFLGKNTVPAEHFPVPAMDSVDSSQAMNMAQSFKEGQVVGSRDELRSRLLDAVWGQSPETIRHRLRRWQLPKLNAVSRWFDQRWLNPILDFSLPSRTVFDRISAVDLLALTPEEARDRFQSQVVILAAGAYEESGAPPGSDNLAIPPGVAYWQDRDPTQLPTDSFPGAEELVYGLHHLLQDHLVIPIPDLWMVGLAIILGKSGALWLSQRPRRKGRWIIGFVLGSAAYGGFTLYVFVGANVLLPWVLPTATMGLHVWSGLRQKLIL